MAVKVSINKVDNVSIDSLKNAKRKIKVDAIIIHSGDNNDLPIPGTDKFTFNFAPNKMGNVKPASGTSFDVDIVPDAKDPNKFTATIEVIPIAYGNCSVSGNKTGSKQWLAAPLVFNITSVNEIPVILHQPAKALLISATEGKPDDPDNLVTQLIVQVQDKDKNPIPETQVFFMIKNTRTDANKQTAVFYDNLKRQVKLAPFHPDKSISNAQIKQSVDDKGKSTLYIGTNNNPGYLDINISTVKTRGPKTFIYIFDNQAGTEIDAPYTNIGPDLSNYSDETFPVIVTNYTVADDEFVGVFLNDVFQAQVSGKDLNDNDSEVTIQLSTDHLIIGDKTNTENNNTFYARRTSEGDLIDSRNYDFIANGPLPDPKPTNVILDYMVNPNGGVINRGSIYVDGKATDFITEINLSDAASTLLNKMQYTLKVGDIITIHATFQGDYQSDDQFHVNKFKYKKAVDDPKNTAFHITIPAKDITGYGVAKEKGKLNSYAMYYDVTPLNEKKPIAESKTVRGILSTREI